MSRALILMYHAIDVPRSPAEARYCVTPDAFRAQMAFISASGHQLIPLSVLVQAYSTGGKVPDRSIVVTFDDGFECFRRNALPALNEFHVPATLFAVAGKLGEVNSWMTADRGAERKLMDATALREILANGVAVGCHGLSHRPMTQVSDMELVGETADARNILSDALGAAVNLFAYPHGDHGKRERDAVAQAGFVAACGTRSGFNHGDADLYSLRRIDVYGQDTLSDFRRKLEFGTNHVTHMDLARYYLNRLISRIHV